MIISGLLTLLLAITVDTEWYTGESIHFRHLATKAVITPWNNFMYNLDASNLAKHGLHPHYQHAVANLPQLLGPAILLLFFSPRRSMLLYSALCGVAVLSVFKHQEARFLLPAVPLLLSSVRIPKRIANIWMGVWIVFNLALGLLMGVYHQGGVVPAQLWVGSQGDITQVYWWKTYSPPNYLLGHNGGKKVTKDLMGMRGDLMIESLTDGVRCDLDSSTLLVAPLSAKFLDEYIDKETETSIALEEVFRYRAHVNLDDMDFGDDGIISTLSRVVGRRGIGAWKVRKLCPPVDVTNQEDAHRPGQMDIEAPLPAAEGEDAVMEY